MKETIYKLDPIGPIDGPDASDYAEVIRTMRTIAHPDFPKMDAEKVKNMRSAVMACAYHGWPAHLVADYGRPGRGWPAALAWEVPGMPEGGVFVPNYVNQGIDDAKLLLDAETKSHSELA